jgi:DNA-binding SARP family transcriptional activator
MTLTTVAHGLSDAPLTLTTLGGATLVRANGSETHTLFSPGKPLALITYLALSPSRSASRDHLVDLLWADVDPEDGRHALRQTVYYIRRRAGLDLLSADATNVTLTATIAADTDRFLTAVRDADQEEAVRLYGGDFLPDFAVPGGAEFERWAELERQRLRVIFLRVAEEVVRERLSKSRVRDALTLARRVRDVDRLSQHGWRLLLEVLASGHDPIASAVEAESLERLLRDEEIELEPATVASLRLARRVETPSRAGTADRGVLTAELVGREAEYSAILAAWDEVRGSGVSRHLHISAPAGLGKTRLLHDVFKRLRALRARVIRLRANPGERQVAYALICELVGILARLPGAAGISPAAAGSLLALNPSISAILSAMMDPSTGDEALRRRTTALVELLVSVGEEQPIAILIDDIHWLDPQSRQILTAIASRLASYCALLVTAGRPVGLGQSDFEQPIRLSLSPLRTSAVAEFVSSIATLPTDPWTERFADDLTTASGGSPLLVLETLELALERELLMLSKEGWRCPDATRLSALLQSGSALANRLARLEPASRQALLLLATAGVPCSSSFIARAAQSSDSSVDAAFADLEHRGLVSRAGESWEPAHDEIAATILEGETADAQRAAHVAVGLALASGSKSSSELRRAAGHFSAGGDRDALHDVFSRFVRLTGVRGEPRRLRQLAQELLGDRASPSEVESLVRAAPLAHRLAAVPTWSWIAVTIVLASSLAVRGIIARRPPEPPPEAQLLVADQAALASGFAYVLDVNHTSWVTSAPLTVDTLRRMTPPKGTSHHVLARHPLGLGWAFSRDVPEDSGVIDIFTEDAAGNVRRRTFAVGDDMAPSWSPDGRYIAFMTARWVSQSRYDIAIVDTRTDSVRPLTTGEVSDNTPLWSPEGTRIAFIRRAFDQLRPDELCWITVDATLSSCESLGPFRIVAHYAWHGSDEIIGVVDSAGRRALARIHVGTREVRVVEWSEGIYRISPDGRWVACLCERSGIEGTAWYVFPLEAPDRARRLHLGDSGRDPSVNWVQVPQAARHLDSLRLMSTQRPIPIDMPFRLQVHGIDASGDQIAVPVRQWHSADTTLATVDSLGIVSPKRVGSVEVTLSAGGWRQKSVVLSFGPTTHSVVLRTSWEDGVPGAWRDFGYPPPRIVNDEHGTPSFWIAGDGSYHNGVYSRGSFDARRGLGVEVALSTPLNRVQWQNVYVTLSASLDSLALSDWDHRTGAFPNNPDRTDCGFGYPAGEGLVALDRIITTAAGESSESPAPRWLRLGRRYVVRVQILADGRCGVALDGRPLWLSRRPVPTHNGYHAVIGGNSAGTRILIGAVEMWTGVRNDIPWSQLELLRTGQPR